MKKPLIAILAGLGLLMLSWLFPPWQMEVSAANHWEDVGFHCFLVKLPYLGMSHPGHRIDFGRLILMDLSIVAMTAGAVLVLRQPR